MPNLFPYTNTHELNLDWVLQVVKDFQTKYTTFDQALADALEAIETAKTGSLEDMQTALTAALESISGDLASAQAAISTDQASAQAAISADRADALQAVQFALTSALATLTSSEGEATARINSLYNTLPTSAQDIINRMNILDDIITGNTPESFVWLQGDYIYEEGVTPPTPPAINTESEFYNYRVSSRYMTGVGGRRIRIITDGTIEIAYLLNWRNTPPGGSAGAYVPGQGSLTTTFFDLLLPMDVTAISIELKKPGTGVAIAPADIDGHIEIQWITDFVSQRIIAPKEESLTANVARLAGENFFYEGVLYEALTDIAIGDTIVLSGSGATAKEVTIGEEFSDLKSALGQVNYTVNSGKYINYNTGNEESVDAYNATGFINCQYFDVYVKTYVSNDNSGICFYDENKVFIPGSGYNPYSDNGVLTKLTKPEGTVYVRVSCLTNSIDNLVIRFEEAMTAIIDIGRVKADKTALANAIHGGYNAVWQENPSAPYNDFDTLPNNSIILYSLAWTEANGISHGPNSSYGFVVTEAHNSDFANAKTQIAYDITGKTYTRVKYNSWTSWTETANAATVSSNYNETIHGGYNSIWQTSPSAPYDDMDTLPLNSVLIYTQPWANVSHAPISTEKGMVFTFAYKSSDSAIQSQIALTTSNKLYTRAKFSTWTAWKYYADDKELTENIVQDYFSSLSVFENIGILGDSFASGEIYTNSGNTHAEYYNLSWGQILARKCGVNVFNYSVGGMSTRTFLTNNGYGLPKLLSDPARNLYIIAFGLNDGGISDYLGTAADMNVDYTQNPDTFYGNYARIIGNLKTHAPNAKIILIKMQRNVYPEFNAAIGTIAEHFSLPCIDPMDDSFFTSTFYTGGLVDWHPTAILYGGMAEAYCRLFSKCAIAYRSYFADYVG